MTAGSEKRWFGLVLVLAALLAAAVVASGSRPAVPGLPLVAPPPGPPGVGDCLTDRIDPSQIYLDDDTSQPAAYPTELPTPCQGAHFGEVANVLSTAPARPVVSTTTYSGAAGSTDQGDVVLPIDALALHCQRFAEAYAGVPDSGQYETLQQIPNRWFPIATIVSAVVRPSVRQVAAGQDWGACVALPSVQATADPPFTGTLKNAYQAGYPAADLISLCDKDDDESLIGLSQVSCRTAHRVEYFGYTQVDGQVALAALQRSCIALAAARMSSSDPTRGDSLSVRAIAAYTAADGSTEIGVHEGGSAVCEVTPATPGRELAHSIANLGERPVPFA